MCPCGPLSGHASRSHPQTNTRQHRSPVLTRRPADAESSPPSPLLYDFPNGTDLVSFRETWHPSVNVGGGWDTWNPAVACGTGSACLPQLSVTFLPHLTCPSSCCLSVWFLVWLVHLYHLGPAASPILCLSFIVLQRILSKRRIR